jgi:hypothetical protein
VLKKLIIGASVMLVLATGFVFAGQNTGGDKNKRGITSGLNPQPLPPGRRHYRRRHRRHRRH